jgi:ELWxxDGT repeat protein
VAFSATTPALGREPWWTDGTEDGTQLVEDIHPSGDSMADGPQRLVVLDGVVYFTADDGDHGRELWRSDGTEGGTSLVKDINPTGSP